MKTIIIDGTEYSLTPVVKEQVFSDWRLPTIKELLTLVNYNKNKPACDLQDIKSSYYWSCSTTPTGSSLAWRVDFLVGSAFQSGMSSSFFVRCVRDGKDGLEWSSTSQDTMTYDEALEYAESLVAPVYYKGRE